MKNKREIGNFGEKVAEKYLKKRGWRIISNNFKSRQGEIDLIGYRFGTLAYFEVKTRRNDRYGSPADAVDSRKISCIQKTTDVFLNTYGRSGRIPVFYPFGIEKLKKICRQRIDVIEVYINDSGYEINHIKAFNIEEEL